MITGDTRSVPGTKRQLLADESIDARISRYLASINLCERDQFEA
jgi:hypothetical protein